MNVFFFFFTKFNDERWYTIAKVKRNNTCRTYFNIAYTFVFYNFTVLEIYGFRRLFTVNEKKVSFTYVADSYLFLLN